MPVLTVCAASLAIGMTSINAEQKTSTTDAAQRMSGTWTINTDLSPSFKPSGRSGGRSGRSSYAIASMGMQRGRGNNPGAEATPSAPGDLTPAERAEQNAMHLAAQIAPTFTIKATEDVFSVVDSRGEHTCAINDKSAKHDVFGAPINEKCRWNKLSVQQELSTTRSKLTRTWSVDDAGHLVVKTRMEGLGERVVEAAAIYDRKTDSGS